jgi:hypothetical protein
MSIQVERTFAMKVNKISFCPYLFKKKTYSIPRGKGWSARKADNLTVIYESVV